ncbi:hypothetical protein SAMN02910447_01020 [Ruminococcus sp. YE71]|uniref:hypothetical protein n=1 Tax=unclassified Ruminococcus TaxID=2608920 RepID=UPI0008851527|nr:MULTISPECIES: hypothetical protein [unclassified Ruminococcus]SDA15900.1 hypothetical protein SAMN02910446_01019 [Ruminococcus sp. YE78]SFW23429.1 hypothetical protein SAMN02910447_01020 [Ruminococcus sp. YE71]
MNDSEKSMKYFIIFALGAAVVLPVGGEVFANISHGFGIGMVAVWAVLAGVKFSSLPFRNAMLGVSAYVFSAVVLSLIGYVVIHPAVKSWLEANSTYFELSLVELAGYWAKAFALLACSYLIYFGRLGFRAAVGKFEKNSSETSAAIENAFEDDEP